MCLPAIPLAIASTAIAAGGQIYGGLSANAASNYEAAVATQNRNLELAARGNALERGEQEQTRHWRRVAQAYGEQAAAQAASGLDVGYGSPADNLADVMMIGYEDSRTISQNTVNEIRGYEMNAANYLMQGRAAKSRGRAALIGAGFGVASTILGGATKVSQLKKPNVNFGATG